MKRIAKRSLEGSSARKPSRHGGSRRPLGLLAALVLAIAGLLALAASPALAAPPAFKESFTHAGATQPWGMAFDSSGNLFLADAEAQVIDKFDSSNAFKEQIGAGEFPEEYTRSVAVNTTTGIVYVGESGSEEVFVFKPKGGGGYELIQEEYVGSYLYVAVDNSTGNPSSGHVIVIGGSGASVRNYATNGAGELTGYAGVAEPTAPPYPEKGFGLYGGSGATLGAGGIAVDPSNGHLYIAGPGRSKVWVYGPEGTLKGAITGVGKPIAVAALNGNVYVADETGKVVDVLKEKATPYEYESLGQLEEAGNTGVHHFTNPALGLAVKPTNGDVYVTEAGSANVDVFGTAGKTQPLTVTKTGEGAGTVTSSPAGINCGLACEHKFPEGGEVTLTATANAISKFTGWSGSGCSGTGTCHVTMSAAKSVTADFGPACSGAGSCLTLNIAGGSGTVVSNPAGIECSGEAPSTCKHEYALNQLVTLTASPASGYAFSKWKGCTTPAVGLKCEVTMSAAKTVEATFVPTDALKVEKAGTGYGKVTATGIGCDENCSTATSRIQTGKLVKIKTTPAKGSQIAEIEGGTGSAAGCEEESACEFTIEANQTFEVYFERIPTKTVTVDLTGPAAYKGKVSGKGIVKGLLGSAVNCGAGCTTQTESFFATDEVTLSAVAATGYTFAGWTISGGSAGTCVGTTTPCTVKTDANKTISAEFK